MSPKKNGSGRIVWCIMTSKQHQIISHQPTAISNNATAICSGVNHALWNIMPKFTVKKCESCVVQLQNKDAGGGRILWNSNISTHGISHWCFFSSWWELLCLIRSYGSACRVLLLLFGLAFASSEWSGPGSVFAGVNSEANDCHANNHFFTQLRIVNRDYQRLRPTHPCFACNNDGKRCIYDASHWRTQENI